MGRKRKSKAVLGQPEDCPKTNETIMSRFISQYFHIANLGNPDIVLKTWKINKWFRIPHCDSQFGWIWFAYLSKLCKSSVATPQHLKIMAPYIRASSDSIKYFFVQRPFSERQKMLPYLREINKHVNSVEFPDHLEYGVLHESQVYPKHKYTAQAIRYARTRELKSPIPGICTGNKDQIHGPIIQSLHGLTCTSCGQVGSRIVHPNFETLKHAQAKHHTQSLVSGRTLTNKDTQIGCADLMHKAMTRAQFEAWLNRPYQIFVEPLKGTSTNTLEKPHPHPKEERHLTHDYKTWLLYLFDFIHDHTIDKSRHAHKMVFAWTQAIWVYGYLVWITVSKWNDSANGSMVNRYLFDTYRIVQYMNPVQSPSPRLLEYFCRYRQVTYLRVVGTNYRFYPETLLEPQFVLQPDSPDTMFANQDIYHISQLHQKLTNTKFLFWKNQYQLTLNSGGQILVSPTLKTMELYVHLAIPKTSQIQLNTLSCTGQTYCIQQWNDPILMTKCPGAQHFLVHIVHLRNKSTPCTIQYSHKDGTMGTVSVLGIDPTMKSQTLKFPKTRTTLMVRKARISLYFHSKSWKCHLNPEQYNI